jgi:hypothetical protein
MCGKYVSKDISRVSDDIRSIDDREVRVSAAAAAARTMIIGSTHTGGEEAEAMMLLLISYLSDAIQTLGKAKSKIVEEALT